MACETHLNGVRSQKLINKSQEKKKSIWKEKGQPMIPTS